MDRLQIDESQADGSEKFSRKPHIIIAALVVCVICLFVPLAVLVSQKYAVKAATVTTRPTSARQDDVCWTSGCVKAAGIVMASIDETVDPCRDFTKFTCGNWVKKNIISEDRTSITTLNKLSDDVRVQLKGLLEEPVAVSDSLAVTKAKEMYSACMDEERIETLGIAHLLDLLDRRFGGWPMIDSNWNETAFNLFEFMAMIYPVGGDYLFNFYIGTDPKNSTNHILQNYQTYLGLPTKDYFLSSNYSREVAAYKQFIVDTATYLGGSMSNTTRIENDTDDLIDFIMSLARIAMSNEELREEASNYAELTVEELYTNISSQFDWKRYFRGMFGHVNYTLSDSEHIILFSKEHMTKLVGIILTTPKRTLANYVLWRFTSGALYYLPKKLQDISRKFNKIVHGTNTQKPRWDNCVGSTANSLPMAVGRLFVEQHFREEAKESMLEMIRELKSSFNELLQRVPWMDENTKTRAKEKSDAMRERIGYPDWLFNDTKLNSEYEGLLENLHSTTYFWNMVNKTQFYTIKQLKTIDTPVDRDRFPLAPAVVNARYSSYTNEITFPAAILQPPYWQEDRPMAMNYGGIGAVIGHEITHGFDDQGRKFDKNGNLVDWWDEAVIAAFNEAKQCIVDQYGNYSVPQLNNKKLNGRTTQGENIADNGGVRQAYQAFLNWQRKNGEGARLPGLEKYSPNQLFFIATGQLWCSAYKDKALDIYIETDPHSPEMFRPIGALSNFAEFSKHFHCPTGSPMNPSKKCDVW